MKIPLATQTVHIEAPRELVFQMLSAIGRGNLPGAAGEKSRVLKQEGNTIIAEFFTTSGKRVYRTLEEVRLYPPEKVTFRHLEGPLHYSQEAFFLADLDGATELTYTGEIECRVPFLPGIGWLIGRYYVLPKYNEVIRRHMAQLKDAAEARASRSHLFRRLE